MSGMLDALKALVSNEPVPTVVKDEEYPNEQAAGFWDDQSMSNGMADYVVPAHVTAPDTFRPTVEHNVPYRGVVDHGVETDEPSIDVGPMPQELAEARRDEALAEAKRNQMVEVVHPPVPVTVVEMPKPTAQDYRMVTAAYLLDTVTPVKIAPRRQQRNKVTFSATAGASVLIGTSGEVVKGGQGFLIPVGGTYESETTDEVWAIASAATPNVYVVEEFVVTVGEVAV